LPTESLGMSVRRRARLQDSHNVIESRANLSEHVDAHQPFQIDGNFDGCASIAETLLQNCASEIELLPAALSCELSMFTEFLAGLPNACYNTLLFRQNEHGFVLCFRVYEAMYC